MISPLYAANNLILMSITKEVALTNLKLQKLLYLLYAKYYHDTKTPLFSDRFEAWQYGPVLRDIYNVFKSEGSNRIGLLRPDANGDILIVTESGAFGEALEHVWNKYGSKTAANLVDITHGKDESTHKTAWRKAVEGGGFGTLIKDEDIAEDGEAWFG